MQVCKVILFILSMEGFQPLRGDAEKVGDGKADAAGSDVQTEYAVGLASVNGHG